MVMFSSHRRALTCAPTLFDWMRADPQVCNQQHVTLSEPERVALGQYFLDQVSGSRPQT